MTARIFSAMPSHPMEIWTAATMSAKGTGCTAPLPWFGWLPYEGSGSTRQWQCLSHEGSGSTRRRQCLYLCHGGEVTDHDLGRLSLAGTRLSGDDDLRTETKISGTELKRPQRKAADRRPAATTQQIWRANILLLERILKLCERLGAEATDRLGVLALGLLERGEGSLGDRIVVRGVCVETLSGVLLHRRHRNPLEGVAHDQDRADPGVDVARVLRTGGRESWAVTKGMRGGAT